MKVKQQNFGTDIDLRWKLQAAWLVVFSCEPERPPARPGVAAAAAHPE